MAERKTTDVEWEAAERRAKKGQRRCSYCGSELHTLRDCPELLKRQDDGE